MNFIKELGYGRWNSSKSSWVIPATPDIASKLVSLPSTNEAKERLSILMMEYKKLKNKRILTSQLVKRIKRGEFIPTKPPLKNITLHPHQQQAFQLGISIPHFALLMGQRTGKTPVAIAILGHRYLRGEITKAVIFCPKTVISSWKNQLKKYANFEYQAICGIPDNIKACWTTEGLQIIITNYESSWKARVRTRPDGTAIRETKANKLLMRWNPETVICDESQKIKRANTLQGRNIIKLGRKAKYRGILTGTPIQDPLDWFGQYKFVDPTILGETFGRFREEYAIMGGYMDHKVIGYQNQEQLTKKIHSIAFRITKNDIKGCPELPATVLYAQLEPKAKEIYQEMERESILTLDSAVCTAPIALTLVQRLQQIAGGFIPYTKLDGSKVILQVSKAKIDLLIEYLQEFVMEANQKAIIFANFTPEIEAISKALGVEKIGHVVLTGATKAKDREQIIDQFQSSKSTSIFLCQIRTGGVGITLDAADYCIFYSTGRSLIDYEQAKVRGDNLHKADVEVIHLVVEGSIEEQVIAQLQEHRDLSKMTLDSLKHIIKGGDKMKLKPRIHKTTVVPTPAAMEEELKPATPSKLAELLDELEADLSKQIPNKSNVPQDTKKALPVKSDSKTKTAKTSPDKPAKSSEPLDPSDIITVKDLADSLGTEPRRLRKWLRTNFGGSDGRWEWSSKDPVLETIKAKFKGE